MPEGVAVQEKHHVDPSRRRVKHLARRVVGPQRKKFFFPDNAQEETARLTSLRSELVDEPTVTIPSVSNDAEETKVISSPKHTGAGKHRRENPLKLLLNKMGHTAFRTTKDIVPKFASSFKHPDSKPAGHTTSLHSLLNGSEAVPPSEPLPEKTPVPPIKPGDILTSSTTGEAYTLSDQIGSGGFANVYKATTPDGRTVAVKVPNPLKDREEAVGLTLKEEAAMQMVIDHPNVVRVLEAADGDNPFMVMEYVSGGTLVERMQKGLIPPEEGLSILMQTASALLAMHRFGILHRDIKPGNILLTHTGDIKITDFGLATIPDLPVMHKPGIFLGSPNYAAPERLTGVRGGELAVSDMYSFGVMGQWLLTGQYPYLLGENVNNPAIMDAHLNQQPRAFFELLADRMTPLHAELEKVIARTLAKNPDDRYPDFGALLDHLERIRQGDTLQQTDQTPSQKGEPESVLADEETVQLSRNDTAESWRQIIVGGLSRMFGRKPS